MEKDGKGWKRMEAGDEEGEEGSKGKGRKKKNQDLKGRKRKIRKDREVKDVKRRYQMSQIGSPGPRLDLARFQICLGIVRPCLGCFLVACFRLAFRCL